MAKEHPLHSGIAGVLRHITTKYSSEIDLKLSPECDGGKNIPLFISNSKRNETELCDVDAMIIKNNEINIIIEIEETGFLPTKVCGKFLTSNLAELYQYKNEESIPIKNASILFIQVIDIQKQSSAKQNQFQHIETAINDLLNTAHAENFKIGCIKRYKIIQINGEKIKGVNPPDDAEDKKEYNKEEYSELKKEIENELKL
jgi:hypothetical protein